MKIPVTIDLRNPPPRAAKIDASESISKCAILLGEREPKVEIQRLGKKLRVDGVSYKHDGHGTYST